MAHDSFLHNTTLYIGFIYVYIMSHIKFNYIIYHIQGLQARIKLPN